MKYDYLRKYALKNVFISPTQDRQSIIKPKRITRDYGVKRFARVAWSNIPLPDSQSKWHIYQIGGIHPVVFNYFTKCMHWISLAQSCNEHDMMVDVYTAEGIQLPRFDTYYRYTENNNLIVAVKFNDKYKVNLDKDDVFIRVYSNAYFHMPKAAGEVFIHVQGSHIKTSQDKDDLVNLYNDYKAKQGLVQLFVNGIVYTNPDKIQVEDYAEIVYDKSVYKVKEWLIDDLEDFESVLDKQRKFLLHYEGGRDDFTQDYQDDIDVYIVEKLKDGSERAVYYHKNHKDSMRNVTHRDYSVVPAYVREFVRTLSKQTTPDANLRPEDLYVRLHIRNAGVTRQLQFEHNRILELYKLEDKDIVRAMLGLDSNVDNWRAYTLENSYYTQILRSEFNEVTEELAELAYRYNAASKYIGDTPVMLASAQKDFSIKLPVRARHGSTIYEYNEEGLLLGWYHHYTGKHYFTKNDECKYVEAIIGWGGNTLDEYCNQKNVKLNEVYGYRVYLASNIGNKLSDFKDVTGSNLYTIVGDQFTWTSTDPTDYPVLRSDQRFFAEDYEETMINGSLEIVLASKQNRGSGLAFYKLIAPLGQIDVFLNGKSLIRGLDYFYHEGKVIITNKEYLVDPLVEKQKIHVRFTGFCKKDLSIMDEGDVGFIEHGLLSNNNRYDIREDKVQRVVIDGKFYHKDELVFSEFHQGVSILDVHNGRPYMVKDILVPVKPYTVEDTYALRDQSIEVDKKVSNYFTLKLPQPDRGPVMAIPRRYEVFSPFLTKLILDIKRGYLNLPVTKTGFIRQEVLEICKPYESLLKADPLRDPHAQDIRYVVINPHPMPYVITLSLNGYRFMQKVVEEYAKDLVTLSPSVKTV